MVSAEEEQPELEKITNTDIAILMRVNDLAERYGFKPYDFEASVELTDTWITVLKYGIGDESKERAEQFNKMFRAVGCNLNTRELRGQTSTIIDALDAAIEKAPKQHRRF